MNKNWKIPVLLVSLSLLLAGIFLYTVFQSIYGSVAKNCTKAALIYKEDCVSSMMKIASGKEFSYKERNDAIWTLGQIADSRALGMLKSMYTGNIPDKEPYDGQISQYELQKAIRWCEHGNSTSWMYRRYR